MNHSSLIKSVSSCHCPKCRQGNLFQTSALKLKSFSKMNDKCSNCGQTFMPEPSFYMGAMFVSYALQMVIFLVSYFTIQGIFPASGVNIYVGVMLALILISLPLVYRLSRSIWIHLMIKFDGNEVHERDLVK